MEEIKLTPAQLRLLQTCKNEGGLIVGGIDATTGIRRNVVRALHAKGLIKWAASAGYYVESEWKLTDAGKEYLKQRATQAAKQGENP